MKTFVIAMAAVFAVEAAPVRAQASAAGAEAAPVQVPVEVPVEAGDYHPGCAAVAEAKGWHEVPPEHQAAARACLGAVSVLLYAGKRQGICPPAPVAQPEAAAIVAEHLDENPDAADEAFRSVAQDALSEAFPCKVNKADKVKK